MQRKLRTALIALTLLTPLSCSGLSGPSGEHLPIESRIWARLSVSDGTTGLTAAGLVLSLWTEKWYASTCYGLVLDQSRRNREYAFHIRSVFHPTGVLCGGVLTQAGTAVELGYPELGFHTLRFTVRGETHVGLLEATPDSFRVTFPDTTQIVFRTRAIAAQPGPTAVSR